VLIDGPEWAVLRPKCKNAWLQDIKEFDDVYPTYHALLKELDGDVIAPKTTSSRKRQRKSKIDIHFKFFNKPIEREEDIPDNTIIRDDLEDDLEECTNKRRDSLIYDEATEDL